MVVGEIWRYPVKSMGGEPLRETVLIADGIPGDRVVHARDDDHLLTARNHPALLGFHATLGPDGEPLVDGEPWSSEVIALRIRKAVGRTSGSPASTGRSASTSCRCSSRPTARSTRSAWIAGDSVRTSWSRAQPRTPSGRGRESACESAAP